MQADLYQRAGMLFHEWASLPVDEQSRRIEALHARSPELASLLASLFESDRDARPISAIDQPTEVLARVLAGDDRDDSGQILRLPGITIHQRVGEGGSSDVYEATQFAEHEIGFQRRVAVKIVHAGRHERSLRLRVAREARILAELTHPSIARLYDCGLTADGRPYLVQEYCGGLNIWSHASAHGLSQDERVELLARVAEGITAAHARQIIHRDLKPQNVLMSDVGIDAIPKIIDFGIGKSIGESSAHADITRHETLGTPTYLSPEAASGESRELDTRTDVYGLGLLLHKLIVGRLPHRREAAGSNIHALLANLRADRDDAIASRDLRGERIPAPLRSILHKSLAFNPEDRYATAEGMLADLRAYLRGAPVSAERPSLLSDVSRAFRRHRRASIASVIALSCLAALVIGGSLFAHRVAHFRRAAATSELLYSMNHLSSAVASGRVAEARKLLNELPDTGALRGTVDPAMLLLYGGVLDSSSGLITRFDQAVLAVADGPSGSAFAVTRERDIFHLDRDRAPRPIAQVPYATRLSLEADARTLLVSLFPKGLARVCIETGEVTQISARSTDSGMPGTGVGFTDPAREREPLPAELEAALARTMMPGDSPAERLRVDEGLMIVGTTFGHLYSVDIRDGRILGPFMAHDSRVNSIAAFAPPHEPRFITGSGDGTVRAWHSGTLVPTPRIAEGVRSLPLSDTSTAVFLPGGGVYIDGALVAEADAEWGLTGTIESFDEHQSLVFLTGEALRAIAIDPGGTPVELWRQRVSSRPVPVIATAPSADSFVRIGGVGAVEWREVSTGRLETIIEVGEYVIACAIDRSARVAFVATMDGGIIRVPRHGSHGQSADDRVYRLAKGLIATELHALDDDSVLAVTDNGVHRINLESGENRLLAYGRRAWSIGSLDDIALIGHFDGVFSAIQMGQVPLRMDLPIFDAAITGIAHLRGEPASVRVTAADGRSRTFRLSPINNSHPTRRSSD